MKYFDIRSLSVPLSSLNPRGGDQYLVQDVSLSLEQGEILGILGPTGCGKTQLLKAVAGLTRPYGGTVSLDGECLDDLHPSQRHMSMVFQDYALYPHMTGAQNIRFPLLKSSEYRAHPQARVAEIARLLSLEEAHLLERRPRSVSGGEKQRIAIGKAIAALPPVVLLDEPLSNVDEQLRFSLRHSIRQLLKDNGITALYVSHNQLEIAEVADRIAVMYQGRIEQSGTYRELYEDPKRYFVSLFLGEHGTSYLTAEQSTQLSQGRIRLALTIRPHQCSLDPLDSTCITLQGQAAAIENHFQERIKVVYLEYEGRLFGCVVPWDRDISRFQPITLYLPLSAACLFDEQGDRVYNTWD